MTPTEAKHADDVSPAMLHYLETKRIYPDCLLFYRMGDFYEMFFEDAEKAARALDIALTKRGKHQGRDIPMAGVPIHAADSYLTRLIRQGFRVAVCEQLEDPQEARKRGKRGPLRRDVVRVVTPGTLTEDNLLDARANNHLIALSEIGGEIALAAADMSTGAFFVETAPLEGVDALLYRLAPTEILASERLLQQPEWVERLAEWKKQLTPLPQSRFDSEQGQRRLLEFYQLAALDGLGAFSRAERAAAGALLDYVELTQRGRMPRLDRLVRIASGSAMGIDAATARNLELTQTLSGEKSGSLLSVIDRTHTGAGARMLNGWLAAPLTDPAAIRCRQDTIEYLMDRNALFCAVRLALQRTPDLERPLSRLSLGRGGPRDLAAVRDGLKQAAAIRALLLDRAWPELPAEFQNAVGELESDAGSIDRLSLALGPDLPLHVRDGNFIAQGYDDALDHLRCLRDDAHRLIANLQARYIETTGIAGLKIRHNNLLGYYIEVTAAHADKLAEPFIHRQSLSGSARFTTVELSDLERDLTRAGESALALEINLFEALNKALLERADKIKAAASALARIDVVAGLADLAMEMNYVRPRIDDSMAFEIAGGRHPVVEALLPNGPGAFVANDCDLAEKQRLWLITGPNMAGKSTFLRQNALIAVLAQMGSFVPAASAHLGVVDRLFSRVGAADDLARGRSTFMVEMIETAAILNRAGPRALVVLDEIGRGTATFDGLSIAWATIEHLHDVNRCRALFATHYHELTALAGRLEALSCHALRVKEWQGSVVFLHEINQGTADRSYGIHVARLAGLPETVIRRAEHVLGILEKSEQHSALTRLADDLPLFAALFAPVTAPAPSPAFSPTIAALEQAVRALRPDELTPKQALDTLYRLRSLLQDRKEEA